MALTKTPVCDFGKKAEDFKLKSIENKIISLNDVKGEKATLIMFICNHCPYVKAIIRDLAKDCNELKKDNHNDIINQFDEYYNYGIHRSVTGPSFEKSFLKVNLVSEQSFLKSQILPEKLDLIYS